VQIFQGYHGGIKGVGCLWGIKGPGGSKGSGVFDFLTPSKTPDPFALPPTCDLHKNGCAPVRTAITPWLFMAVAKLCVPPMPRSMS